MIANKRVGKYEILEGVLVSEVPTMIKLEFHDVHEDIEFISLLMLDIYDTIIANRL